MNRFIGLALVAMLFLCACSKNAGGSYSEASGQAGDQLQESRASSAVSEPTAAWGSPSDSLKQFDDHDGRKNHYQDYTMTLRFTAGERRSKELTVTESLAGSEFLTSFQSRSIVENPPDFPTGEAAVTLTVTDAGEQYQYLICANGMIYTVQGGKTYYLGQSEGFFDRYQMTFVNAALETEVGEQAESPALPEFDPWGEAATQNSQSEKPDDPAHYDIAVVFVDYEKQSRPVFIRDVDAEANILRSLNAADQSYSAEAVTGGGIALRVFSRDECFNYMIRGDALVDCQSGESYAIPAGFAGEIQGIVAYELACIFADDAA